MAGIAENSLAQNLRGIQRVNLQKLIVFDAMMNERSFSRVAEQMGLTQPAVSMAVKSLKAVFNDDLFIRVRGGYVPTAAAKSIHSVVAPALSKLAEVQWDRL